MINFKRCDTRWELAWLAINQHVTIEQLEARLEALEFKYDNSDAYSMGLQYRKQIAELEQLIALKKKWGVK